MLAKKPPSHDCPSRVCFESMMCTKHCLCQKYICVMTQNCPLSFISEFIMNVKHVIDKDNKVADVLSQEPSAVSMVTWILTR